MQVLNPWPVLGLYYVGWEERPQLDGPGKECEHRIVGSAPQKHILLLVTDSDVAIGWDKVTFGSYGYENIVSIIE